MTRTTIRIGGAALGILLGVAACHNDQLFRPYPNGPLDPLFARYVSMGNSITAGFQSGGLNDSTQLQAYPVLLARQMQTPFFVPLMARVLGARGCPPPIDSVYSDSGAPRLHRLDGATATTCALRRAQPVPPPYINNVAVPGAEVLDGLTNFGPGTNANPYTTFFLGGFTQTQMMMKVDPTFVTVWLGNNDVLGAVIDTANAGNPAKITDTTLFKAQYGAVLDSIALTGARGGVLIGVANVTLIPFLTRGSKFYNVKFGSGANDSIPGANPANRKFPANFLVNPNCAPPAGDSILIPFARGAAVVAFARKNPLITVGVDCSDVHNVSPAELVALTAAVNSYNTYISSQA